MRSMAFRLIIFKKIVQSRGITLNINGCRNKMINGSNGLLGYDKEIVDEVEYIQF